MVNPGTFQGSRGVFLLEQAEYYASAVADGRASDAISDIQRRYLKRYPLELPHEKEPTPEWLSQVDDSSADPEMVEPDYASMDADSAAKAKDDYKRRCALLKSRKDAIKRRVEYIYSKARGKTPGRNKENDPTSILMSKLAGIDNKVPRRRTAYNIWGPRNRNIVDPVFNSRVKQPGVESSQHAAIRSAVYKELFESLPAVTREYWNKIAADEHDAAVAELKRKRRLAVSTAPLDRQNAIASLPKFVEPIIDMIADYTGWRVTLIAGGPEPADGGRLNMVSIHSGVTAGSIKMDFGRSESASYKTYISPAFGTFLKKCYTIAECKSRALSDDHTCISLNDLASDDDIKMDLHTFDTDAEHMAASLAATQKGKRLFEDIALQGSSSSRPLTGTPSPPVRFVPSLGNSKAPNRVPPTSDGNPRNHRPLSRSPLSQNSVSAEDVTAASPNSQPNSATHESTSKEPAAGVLAHSGALPVDQSVEVGAASAPTDEAAAAAAALTKAASATPTDEAAAAAAALTKADAATPTKATPTDEAAAAAAALTKADAAALTDEAAAANAATPTEEAAAAAAALTKADAAALTDEAAAANAATPTEEAAAAAAALTKADAAAPTNEAAAAALTNEAAAAALTNEAAAAAALTNEAAAAAALTNEAAAAAALTNEAAAAAAAPTDDAAAATAYAAAIAANAAAAVAVEAGAPMGSPPRSRPVSPAPSPRRSRSPSPVRQVPPGWRPSGTATVPSNLDDPLPSKSRKRKAATPSTGSAEGIATRAASGKRARTSVPPVAVAAKRKGAESPGASPSKKFKAQDGGDRAFSVEVADTCPPWVRNGLKLLTRKALGAKWEELVQAWVAFEAKSGFGEKSVPPLPARGRPQEVSAWIKRARAPNYAPDVDVGALEAAYTLWWRSMQPEWRLEGHAGELNRDGAGDLDGVACSGLNGMLSVLAALCFWGGGVSGGGLSETRWHAALDDVLFVLTASAAQ